MDFSTFGWESVHRTVESDIKKEDDVLLVFIHWLLLKHDFVCIGLGETADDTSSNYVVSEILPPGWNSGETYAVRYFDAKKNLFILRGLKNDVNIIFNLIRSKDLNISSLSFNPKEEVKALKGSLESVVPKYKDVGSRVLSSLIRPQVEGKSSENSTQTSKLQEETPLERRDPSSLRVDRRQPDSMGSMFDFGRSDLDPLSSLTNPSRGGMLFNPFGERTRFDPSTGLPGPTLPRGAVPPGARFDPFGPPDADRHFGKPWPPFMGDDMFM